MGRVEDGELDIHEVRTVGELELIRELAFQTWGDDAADSVATLIVHARYGGVILIAQLDGVPVGFSYAFPAQYRNEFVLWSHETAVIKPDRHIGRGLKQYQFEVARRRGYSTIAWTFDPLVARNAYFNIAVLGTTVTEFLSDAYSVLEGSSHTTMPLTDRFVVTYSLTDNPNDSDVFGRDGSDSLAILRREDNDPRTTWLLRSGGGAPSLVKLDEYVVDGDDAGELCLAIPVSADGGGSPDAAVRAAWSLAFRTAAIDAFARGLRPVGVVVRSDGRVHGYHMSHGHFD